MNPGSPVGQDDLMLSRSSVLVKNSDQFEFVWHPGYLAGTVSAVAKYRASWRDCRVIMSEICSGL